VSESALAPHIELVRLYAEAALVRRLNAGYGFADSRVPSELYLRDAGARERLSRDALRPSGTHLEQQAELDEAIAAARKSLAEHDSQLRTVHQRFDLAAAEAALVDIAVAYELDSDVRDLCHALAGRRTSTLTASVCQLLHPALSDAATVLRALHVNGVLRRGCLLDVSTSSASAGAKLTSSIAPARRLLDWLLGDERIAAPLHTALRIYAPDAAVPTFIGDDVVVDIDRVAQLLESHADEATPAVLIQGPMGVGRRAAARMLAARLGRPLAAASLGELLDLQARTGDRLLMRKALSEARLRGAIVLLSGIEAVYGDSERNIDATAIEAIDEYDGLAIITTAERGMPRLPIQRAFHLIRMRTPTLDTRGRAWANAIAAVSADAGGLPPEASDVLAGRYVIGPGTIAEVMDDAHAFASASGENITQETIEQAVGRRLSLRLGAFGTLITRRARFEEMVLPEDVTDTIDDMIAMVRERSQILERWGYADHLGLSRGVSALFSGEPGTGKTMAASAISGALGLELIRIDLSSVVSKWVGETEKHLGKIFDEAQTANAMLLFDEADSLFGKRTDVKSAQDRYANLEVNYILQRMESFDGISVLTTNMEGAIDQAFMRRLNFRVRFPDPEPDEREKLWRALLPPGTGVAADVDFEALANRFDMTGGHIRNAIVRGAVIAARAGRELTPRDLELGALHEYAELGKVMPDL
jgi:hypothetical protein